MKRRTKKKRMPQIGGMVMTVTMVRPKNTKIDSLHSLQSALGKGSKKNWEKVWSFSGKKIDPHLFFRNKTPIG